MTLKRVLSLLACASILLPFALRAHPLPVATVEDAVRMTRIQYSVASDGSVAAISPDGRKAAAVTWRGDIARNLNVYTLKLFDLVEPGLNKPEEVLSWDFAGDPNDQTASPFSQLMFLADNRTLAFIGREGEAPAQVYIVDTATQQLRQLTRHPTAVRSFVVGPDGRLHAFSAVASAGEGQQKSRLDEDGVFMWDFELFPWRYEFSSAFPVLWNNGDRQIRQYFLFSETQQPKPFFDSRRSRPAVPLDMSDPDVASSPTVSLEDENALAEWATLTGDPTGQSLLLFPYGLTEHPMQTERYAYYDERYPRNAYVRRVSAPLGVVDLTTGRIERLIDAPSPQFERESGAPLWELGGRSAIVFTLLPDAPAEPPQWVEVDIATRAITPLGLPEGWKPVAWADEETLLLGGQGGHFGSLRREPGKGWGTFTETGAAQDFNPHWAVASNGRVAIGVRDATLSPPELVAYDLASGQSTVLSDFNPELRQRRYGTVELLQWESQHQKDAAGFLIRPVDYQPGNRYPLVILLDNNTMRREGEPYLLDAVWQLSGHAIQMLAAQGFMVLYPRMPVTRDVVETMAESERMRDNIESAIAHLDRAGLIDLARVGLSGWSRAGYYTDYTLIHSPSAFAAATTIDGGASEYNEGMRPFTDDELLRIRTPKLFQSHGVYSLVHMSAMADRMSALGKPAEILYFHTASHSTTRPQHRLRSLGTHIDWWRFWLKDEEDADPAKEAQYVQWRRLREMQQRP